MRIGRRIRWEDGWPLLFYNPTTTTTDGGGGGGGGVTYVVYSTCIFLFYGMKVEGRSRKKKGREK